MFRPSMFRPSDGMTFDELRHEFDWIYEFQSRMAERIRGDADVHNLVDYVSKLESENAKLRELLLHMHTCMGNVDADGNHECFSCEYEGAECDFDRRMRELGIEVDG